MQCLIRFKENIFIQVLKKKSEFKYQYLDLQINCGDIVSCNLQKFEGDIIEGYIPNHYFITITGNILIPNIAPSKFEILIDNLDSEKFFIKSYSYQEQTHLIMKNY